MNVNNKIFQLAIKSRKFQIEINNGIKNGKFSIPIHLAFGHEFVASLVKANFIQNRDSLLLTHRNIHFTSIFSKTAKEKYKDFEKNFYKKKPNFGSMNYLDNNSDIKYTSSILGNNFSVACGISETVKNSNSLVVCVTGDGAIEEGTFYESLTLAKYLKLKIIFVVENNNWSMATTINQRRCKIDLKKLASSIGVDYYHFPRKKIKNNIKKYSAVVKKIRIKPNPTICEFDVKTLGSFKKNKKIINYHHGAMKLKYRDKIYIKKNSDDILYTMAKYLK